MYEKCIDMQQTELRVGPCSAFQFVSYIWMLDQIALLSAAAACPAPLSVTADML